MSRIGKNPIKVQEGVSIDLQPDYIKVKGKLGELKLPLTPDVKVSHKDQLIYVEPKGHSRLARSMWGTTRANIANLIQGVCEGFTKTLEINGVGYRTQIKGKKIILSLGLSHDVEIDIPEGITVKAPKPTILEISSYDKQFLGQFASNIRVWRRPEPYKGKGIKYSDEYIVRKEGKKK